MDAVISFPKSGRTWLRVMLDQYELPLDWTHANAGHGPGHPISRLNTLVARKYGRVLFLHRDPRDTVVSGFHQKLLRRDGYNGTISDFIRDPRHGIEKIVQYNDMWMALAKTRPKMIVESYEALQQDTTGTFARILSFFGKDVDMQRIQEIVETNVFSKMQARERGGYYARKYGRSLTPSDPNEPNSFKVRKGKVGSYLEELSPADIDYCNRVMAGLKAAA